MANECRFGQTSPKRHAGNRSAAPPLEFKFLFLGRKRKEPSPNSFLIDPAYAPLPPAWRGVGKHWRVISDEPWPDDRQTTTAPRICFVSLRVFDPLRRTLKRREETRRPGELVVQMHLRATSSSAVFPVSSEPSIVQSKSPATDSAAAGLLPTIPRYRDHETYALPDIIPDG